MIVSIFGLLMLPMQRDRRILANELETIQDSLQDFKNARQPIVRPLLGTYYENDKWYMGLATHAANELRGRSFFKRFTNEDIVQFLPKMRVEQFEPQQLIFPDYDVCIILAGLVETKYHKFGDRVPKPHAKYREGDVLGFIEGDNGATAHVETWSVCVSRTEVIWMSRADFAELWGIQSRLN